MSEAVVLPVPRHGEVFTDARDGGRALRVTWHPEARRLVLSMWRDGVCVGTHQLPADDVLRLVHALVDGLAAAPAT